MWKHADRPQLGEVAWLFRREYGVTDSILDKNFSNSFRFYVETKFAEKVGYSHAQREKVVCPLRIMDMRAEQRAIEREKKKRSDESSPVCTHRGGGGIDKIDSSFSVTSLLNLLLIGTADTSNVIPAIILTGPIIACKIIIISVFRRSYPYLNTRIGEKWLMKQFSIVLSVSKAVRCKNICLW